MKQLLLTLAIFIAGFGVWAQQPMSPSTSESTVTFKIRNFGFEVDGSFSGIRGTFVFDPASLSTSKFDVTVESSSVFTDNTRRDTHLKADDFFDAAKYPQIRLTSQAIEQTESGFLFNGNIIIKGISEKVIFPFTAVKKGDAYTFTGKFSIDRLKFSVGGESATLSDEVTVNLQVVAR